MPKTVLPLQAEGETVIFQVFSKVIPSFGVNDAKVLWSTLSTDSKSAEQIAGKIGVDKAIVYRVLKKLEKQKLVSKTNTVPALYFVDKPKQRLKVHITKVKNGLDKELKKFEKLLNNASSQSGEKYLIEINGGQTKIINQQTRQSILDDYCIKEITKAFAYVRDSRQPKAVVQYKF